jgi:hypothetical protein
VSGTHANFEALEGTVTTETTLTFNRRSRRIVITNDDPSNSLSYKFNDSEAFGTLKGTETLSIYFSAKQIIIDGSSVDYRIWVYG